MTSKPNRPRGPLAKTHYDLDTREVPRLKCPVRPALRVSVRPSFLPITVTVNDISTKGIGLLAESHIEIGASLAAFWGYGSPERWRTLRFKAVRRTPGRDGNW